MIKSRFQRRNVLGLSRLWARVKSHFQSRNVLGLFQLWGRDQITIPKSKCCGPLFFIFRFGIVIKSRFQRRHVLGIFRRCRGLGYEARYIFSCLLFSCGNREPGFSNWVEEGFAS